ncbi:MYND finger [Purpureocillium lilacinum]|uniref:MYND finger n=1 Tax=Purpureocillium lilacinum TaxID=33203 RepID=A0A179H8T6_PURLI|nr:MYND finger [Purpureocillium lilacinum]OAQ85951.1 MYND finger [Purpureocillium lilacinum]
MPLIMNAELDKLNGLAPRACELCHRRDDVKRCTACQAVYYCGRECQAADRDDHKIPCKVIKKARVHYESEYVKLRDMPGDMLTPEKMFENEVGHFWGILETRPYMRARYGLVDALLLSYGTPGGPVDVVQMCLDHLLDMMRLCRGDNMGVRQVVPGLYIRLGRDQDAYDFISWHTAKSEDSDFDWGDMSLPFLDTKDANALEEPPERWLRSPWLPLSHAVAVTLIKVRILLDLRAIQNARVALRGAVPDGIVELIRSQLVGSVVGARRDVLLAGPEETARLADTVRGQVRKLYDAVDKYNPHFWKILVEKPDAGVLERPAGPYGQQSRDEALLMVGYNFASWYETPGAIDVLRSLAGGKASGK